MIAIDVTNKGFYLENVKIYKLITESQWGEEKTDKIIEQM